MPVPWAEQGQGCVTGSFCPRAARAPALTSPAQGRKWRNRCWFLPVAPALVPGDNRGTAVTSFRKKCALWSLLCRWTVRKPGHASHCPRSGSSKKGASFSSDFQARRARDSQKENTCPSVRSSTLSPLPQTAPHACSEHGRATPGQTITEAPAREVEASDGPGAPHLSTFGLFRGGSALQRWPPGRQTPLNTLLSTYPS